MYSVKINNQIMIEKADFATCMKFIENWMKENSDKGTFEIGLECLDKE